MSYQVVADPVHVREVMRRTEDFLPTNALTAVVPLSPAARRILAKERFALPPILASATGAQHRQVRTLVAGFFTPAKVAAIGPHVSELTRQRASAVLAELSGGAGSVDLADAIAKHIPPLVMSELIGIECPDLDLFKRWSKDSLELFWGWPDDTRQVELAHSAAEFYRWLRRTVLESQGSENLFGVLGAAGLSTAEICSLGYFLVIAGQETTTQLIATTFFRALEAPKGREAAPANWVAAGSSQSAARAFVQKVLATESSVHTWRRQTAHATQLAGVELPAGAEILLELSGRHGPDAKATDYALAFGYGLHRCLGAKLAELETLLVLHETAKLLPHARLNDADPQWTRLLSFQSPNTVKVQNQSND